MERQSLDRICATLSYALGVEPPKEAAPRHAELSEFIDNVFGGEKADRVVMYNPDAIAQWIYEKYPHYCKAAKNFSDIEVPLTTVMPSVTPVCFATMYTGAQPEVHGIRKYEKPVLKIDTFMDALVRAGKKVALVTYGKCSMGMIFREREIDYYHFDKGGVEAVHAQAAELILRDEHDVILIYNGDYDALMHKFGPESTEALAELRENCHSYGVFCNLIKTHWKHHNTFVGFAMDHGCHEIDDGCGSHGLDMDEDLHIMHLYKAFPKEREQA